MFGLIKLDETWVLVLKYIFSSLGLIPLFMGITNICILKKKHYRIIQVIFWFLMFYIAWSIDDTPDLDFDIIIWLMWLVPLFMGITGKWITSKCMRYREKVTKIRV